MKAKIILSAGISIVALVAVFLLARHDDLDGPNDNSPVFRTEGVSKANRPVPNPPLPVAKRPETNQIVYRRDRIKISDGATIEIDHGLHKTGLRNGEKYPQALTDAKNYGALGAVTLMVVDDRGEAVPDAAVNGGFWNHGKDGHGFETLTDADGLVTVQDTSAGDLIFSIEKTGYYPTRLRYWFFKNGFDCVKDGRWMPWNPAIEVVLKRKVNPMAMCVKSGRKGILPQIKNEYIGFDLEKGDWMKPHGKGTTADLNVRYEYEKGTLPALYYRGAVFFAFTNKHDGAYVMKKDAFSSFKSVYQADTNAVYRQEFAFVYDRLSGTIKENTNFPASDYLIIRTRSRTDEDGNLISANYAKIYGPITTSDGGVHVNFYFNPSENDPNLEADTTRNLLNSGGLGFEP